MSIDIDELRSIISEETGNPLNKIKPDSKLVSELGIDGDDGYELMELLANKYNVDLSNIDFLRFSPRLDNILLKDWCKSL